MSTEKFCRACAIGSVALLGAFGASRQAAAQDTASHYPKMAPVERYLMDRTAEIALARTAAPDSISRHAEVLVLDRHGFVQAVKGTNGFVCIVDRSWSSAPDADFWNPKVRVPMCDNAPAARSHMRHIARRAELILSGLSKAQVEHVLTSEIDSHKLPSMASGAMCYMMSKEGYGGDTAPHWPSHLMFFFPLTQASAWGANLPNSPVFAVSDNVERLTTFAVAVPRWSDGSEQH